MARRGVNQLTSRPPHATLMTKEKPMTDRHSDQDMGWAIPVMQAGYAGRGLVYVIAEFG